MILVVFQPQSKPSPDPLFCLHVFLYNEGASKRILVLRTFQEWACWGWHHPQIGPSLMEDHIASALFPFQALEHHHRDGAELTWSVLCVCEFQRGFIDCSEGDPVSAGDHHEVKEEPD